MSKNNLLNLALLIFILVLVVIVVYEPGKKVAITPPTLTNLESNSIYNIRITRHSAAADEQLLEFEKKSDGWVMLKPYSISANTFRIDSILKLLSAVSLSQNNLENLNPKTFGLDKPAVTITFNNNLSIVFGHNKSLKNHRYIQISSTLHMIADTFLYQLAAKAESYISHKLINTKSKLVKLTLPSMKLEKVKSSWQVTPKADNFSADSANQLINEWQLSQAFDVNKVKPAPKNKTDIVMQLENNKKLRFKIEKSKENFNLINIDTGMRYILSSDRKDKLLKLSVITQDN